MKKLEEKTLSSQEIFRGRFLKVQRDEVVGPDGRHYQREYILHPGAAMIVPVLPNGNVVMVKQYRHAMKQVFIEFPAGKRDKGEEILKTAQRELAEETGYTAKNWKFLTTIHPVIGYSDEHIDLYLAQDLTAAQAKPDQGEFLEVFEVSPAELMQWVREGKISDVKTQIGAFWLDKVLRQEWN